MSVYGQYKLKNTSLFRIIYCLFTHWGVEARAPIQANIRIYSSAGTQIIQPGHQDQGAKAKLHIHPESRTLLEITLGLSGI